MTAIDLTFILGIILIIIGTVKRKAPRGKWILAAGIALVAVTFVIFGYADLKAGFLDALRD